MSKIKICKLRRLAVYLFVCLSLIFICAAYASVPKPIWKGPDTRRLVALTFDDGPKPEYSLKVLDILSKYCVRGTFFIVGKEAEQFPDIIMRMADEGHEIGNHTYSHRNICKLPQNVMEKEIRMASEAVYNITGAFPKLFRPPGGEYNLLTRYETAKYGMIQINWSINAGDSIDTSERFKLDDNYDEVADELINDVVKKTKNGSIVLFHNGSEQTIRALPAIIETLRKRGFGFATVSQLLGKEAM